MRKNHSMLLRFMASAALAAVLLTSCAGGATTYEKQMELGRKYLTEMNYAEAIAAFTEAIKLNPDDIEAYMARAEAYAALEKYDEATADYTAVIEKTGDQPYLQATAYIGRAGVGESTAALTDAESDYTAALAQLEKDTDAQDADAVLILKKKVLVKHAAVCVTLALLEKAADDYDALEALGENVTAKRNELADLVKDTTGADMDAENSSLPPDTADADTTDTAETPENPETVDTAEKTETKETPDSKETAADSKQEQAASSKEEAASSKTEEQPASSKQEETAESKAEKAASSEEQPASSKQEEATQSTTSTAGFSTVAEATKKTIIDNVNRIRVQNGLNPLTSGTEAAALAQEKLNISIRSAEQKNVTAEEYDSYWAKFKQQGAKGYYEVETGGDDPNSMVASAGPLNEEAIQENMERDGILAASYDILHGEATTIGVAIGHSRQRIMGNWWGDFLYVVIVTR